MPVGTGQTDRERHAPPVADQMTFAASLGPVGGIRTSLRATTHRADGTAIDYCPRPVNLVVTRKPIEQRKVHQIPDTGVLPIAQTAPTGHPRPAAQLLRQHLPRNPASEHEQDTSETGSVRDTRSSAIRSRRWNR